MGSGAQSVMMNGKTVMQALSVHSWVTEGKVNDYRFLDININCTAVTVVTHPPPALKFEDSPQVHFSDKIGCMHACMH